MTNQQQLDLLKQESATLWNTWRQEHPNTAIELSRVDLSEPIWVKSTLPRPT